MYENLQDAAGYVRSVELNHIYLITHIMKRESPHVFTDDIAP